MTRTIEEIQSELLSVVADIDDLEEQLDALHVERRALRDELRAALAQQESTLDRRFEERDQDEAT